MLPTLGIICKGLVSLRGSSCWAMAYSKKFIAALTSGEHSIGAFPMKPSETATRASAGHERNQLMVHPFTSPGNLRARSGNLARIRKKTEPPRCLYFL